MCRLRVSDTAGVCAERARRALEACTCCRKSLAGRPSRRGGRSSPSSSSGLFSGAHLLTLGIVGELNLGPGLYPSAIQRDAPSGDSGNSLGPGARLAHGEKDHVLALPAGHPGPRDRRPRFAKKSGAVLLARRLPGPSDAGQSSL